MEEVLRLQSNDGKEFTIQLEKITKLSGTIRNLVEDAGKDCEMIPLPNVNAEILGKLLGYAERDEAVDWSEVDRSVLWGLLNAANYLAMTKLVESMCQHVADLCKGKTPEEIRAEFNIENDLTPEEMEEIKKEQAWINER
jgi:S-phase kinase-associated protein 1